MEIDCRNGEGLENEDCASTDLGNIVVERKTKVRSEKQQESLRAAQAARKLNAAARRIAREEVPTPPPTPAEPVAVSAPGRDYRALYKEQKRELELLRFERAVAERLAALQEREVHVPKEDPKKDGLVLFGNTSAIIRKKNVGPSW